MMSFLSVFVNTCVKKIPRICRGIFYWTHDPQFVDVQPPHFPLPDEKLSLPAVLLEAKLLITRLGPVTPHWGQWIFSPVSPRLHNFSNLRPQRHLNSYIGMLIPLWCKQKLIQI